VGDFNGDGKIDIVTSSGSILFGNGDGTFQAAQNYASVFGSSVAVGDFNRDGIADIVVLVTGIGQLGIGVSIFLGNGDGTFQAAQSYAAGSNPSSVAIADFNSDGYPDLAVNNTILLNDGHWGP
jgi:hypothetical protein